MKEDQEKKKIQVITQNADVIRNCCVAGRGQHNSVPCNWNVMSKTNNVVVRNGDATRKVISHSRPRNYTVFVEQRGTAGDIRLQLVNAEISVNEALTWQYANVSEEWE